MSRTVHHVKHKYRDSTRADDARAPWHWLPAPMAEHRIRGLRYSSAAEAEAAKAGRRPIPEPVGRRLYANTYPRTYGDRSIAYVANRRERALRAADRAAADRARHVVRAGVNAVEAAWDLHWPDPRHRHFAVWDSW